MLAKNYIRVLLSLSCMLFAFNYAKATPLVDFTADNSGFTWYGNNLGCDNGCTLGYSFDVTSAVSIDALGVYDAGSDGLNNTHEIGLWTSSGTLLATTSVGPGSTDSEASASGDGSFVFADISDLLLDVGSYVIGALYEIGDTDHVVFNAGGIFSTDAGVSYGELRFTNTGSLNMPGSTSTSGDRYFGPTMRIASAAVPEPASLSLLCLGLLAIGFSKKRSS